MHNKPHSEEAKNKIKEKIQAWRKTSGYQDYLERQRQRGRKSNTRFKKGHKPYTDGSNLKGLQAGKKHWKWGGGRITAFGYILIHFPDHPFKSRKGYVQEHRLIMEKNIGRYLTREEVIHHINNKKDDNRIDNLKIMTRSEHTKLHLRERYATS